MQILLCAATEMEIAPTIQALSLHENRIVNLLITGVGLMAATYALTKAAVQNRPDLIIQAGVAGTLQPEDSLGRVVVVGSECLGDLGVKGANGFQSLFDLHLLGADTPPWNETRLFNDIERLTATGLPIVSGVTVNEISTDDATIRYYRDQLHVQVESLEGAALHYVGLLEKIPFLQVRSLSNFIGERDKSKWKMKESIATLNREVQKILTKLKTS